MARTELIKSFDTRCGEAHLGTLAFPSLVYFLRCFSHHGFGRASGAGRGRSSVLFSTVVDSGGAVTPGGTGAAVRVHCDAW